MPVIDHIKSLFQFNSSPTSAATSSHPISSYSTTATSASHNEKVMAARRARHYPGLERYQLLERMGEGAFSRVYKALDTQKGELCAVKIVRKYELNNSQRANVKKEVQIMRGLHHPSIVELYGFIETRDYYYLILELLPGGELFQRIVDLTYFSEDLARHCIVQVAEGIKYLHKEKGVAHRDIKPENLLFEPIPFIPSDEPPPSFPHDDEDKQPEGLFQPGIGGGGVGRVKIADFGLSKVVWEGSTRTPCGTLGYTAPEIVRDERYSKSVDMWALGCVLYTMLCGFPPFYDEGEDVCALTHKVARGKFVFLSPWWDPISESAKDLIRRLLCVDPRQRYTIDQFFEHPWIKAEALSPPVALAQHSTARRDLASPGIAVMKEIIDVSYAVQRHEDDIAQTTGGNSISTTSASTPRRCFKMGGNHYFDIKEADEETETSVETSEEETEEEISSNESSAARRKDFSQIREEMKLLHLGTCSPLHTMPLSGHPCPTSGSPSSCRTAPVVGGTHSAAMAAAFAGVVTKHDLRRFELSMERATLLERRKQKDGISEIKV
ncbi:uncharacterized protein VTP21DRAFT_4325 [Calcarisporiella thermophila]|uniref:uncharacterized protein n=1 Tax=Calcarisporiella thermophila TaxID=911321 RepID=UPI0037433EA9